MKRLLGNLILLALIVFVVWRFILPTVLCWQQGGDLQDGVCSMGVIELPGSNLIPDMSGIKERIDFSKLRELKLMIPNATDTSATLSRTNDALESFVATFSKDGSSGSAEALDDLAVTDAETGYALIPFVVNYGGTGSFVYVGLFTNQNGVPVHTDSLLLGDRIQIESLTFERSEGVLMAVANFKDRKPTDAMVVVPSIATRITAPITSAPIFGEPSRTERSDTYIASYKDMIRIANPTPGSTVTTPLLFSGEARGGWFFEASFPITIVDWNGRIIGEGIATATGDWMTSEFVPFTASIPYVLPSDVAYRRGAIILQKDNPSGMPENDDAFEVPILFK